ncbi:hypothetical protein [Edaphovirga cremea]|uniref:hypothetical protein n=1 Tax=Edaphovirga cremea TaxID=2267246 RepID=UPI00398977FC
MGYISTCAIPNTIRRGKNFYLHFRLSDSKLFRASLGSDSVKRTRYIISRLGLFISLVKSARMESQQLLDIVIKMKKLEQKDIDDYLLEAQTKFYAAAKNIPTEIRTSLREGVPLSAEKVNSSAMSNMLGTTFINDSPALLEDTVFEQLSSKYDISGKEAEVDSIAAECDLLWQQVCDAKTAFLHSNHLEYRQILASLEPRTSGILISSPEVSDDITQKENQLTLIEAWSDFVSFTSKKNNWTSKTKKDNEANFEFIKLVLGADTPVIDITKKNIRELLDLAESLPQKNKKPYNKMTLQECLDYDVPEEDLLAPRSVGGDLPPGLDTTLT